MPAAGALADRWGIKPVLGVGLLLGALGFAAFATSGGVLGLVVGQVLNACFIAVLLGLGATYAQRLHPAGAGFATSVFFGAQSLAFATGGATGAASAGGIGLPTMFLVPAALCLCALVIVMLAPRPPETTRNKSSLAVEDA